jgi:ABC transporter DrrB family efflux protein
MLRDQRPTAHEALTDAAVMAERELAATLRKPTLVLIAVIQPVLLVLLFRYVFGGAIETPGSTYVDFLMPGILVLTAIFGSIVTGVGLSQDLQKGIVDRLRSLPIAGSAVLVGRTLSDLARAVASLALVLGIGVLVGFRPDQPVARVAAALALIVGFAYVFSWISASIGLWLRDPETVQSAGLAWVFPLTFASSAFVPTDSMPAAVAAFANVNPVTLCVDAARALMIGGDATVPLLGTLAWFLGLMALFAPLAIRRYRTLA